MNKLKLENLNVEIDTSKFTEEFKEKNISFFKLLNESQSENSDIGVYYVQSNLNYYDLIAVDKEGVFNCIPVSVFAKVMGYDYDEQCGDVSSVIADFETIISRDELDDMRKKREIIRETNKFFDNYERECQVFDIIKDLTNGETIVLSEIEDQFGETISDETLTINDDGLFELWGISCYSSTWHGLGTCQCNSHNASCTQVISPQYALEKIGEYLDKVTSEKEKKETDRKVITKLLELAYM